MKPYVYGVKNGIYIIDLQQTLDLFDNAFNYVAQAVGKGAKVLFVGTKRQAKDIIREEAVRCGMPYVNERWLGGMLTNFKTIKKSIDTLKRIERLEADGKAGGMTKKEALLMNRKREKLDAYLAGIKDISKAPEIMFIVDTKREHIAVKEGLDLGIKLVAPVDTNCDPAVIDYPIPGNDDAMRAIRLYTSRIADAVLQGAAQYQEYQKEEEKRRLEDRARAAAAGEIAPEDRDRNRDRDRDRKRGRGAPQVTKKTEKGPRRAAGGSVPAGRRVEDGAVGFEAGDNDDDVAPSIPTGGASDDSGSKA